MLAKKEEGQRRKASQPKCRGDCSLTQPEAGGVSCAVFPCRPEAPLPRPRPPPTPPSPGPWDHQAVLLHKRKSSGFLSEGGLAAFMNSELNPSQFPVKWNSWSRIPIARTEVISLMGVSQNNKWTAYDISESVWHTPSPSPTTPCSQQRGQALCALTLGESASSPNAHGICVNSDITPEPEACRQHGKYAQAPRGFSIEFCLTIGSWPWASCETSLNLGFPLKWGQYLIPNALLGSNRTAEGRVSDILLVLHKCNPSVSSPT